MCFPGVGVLVRHHIKPTCEVQKNYRRGHIGRRHMINCQAEEFCDILGIDKPSFRQNGSPGYYLSFLKRQMAILCVSGALNP